MNTLIRNISVIGMAVFGTIGMAGSAFADDDKDKDKNEKIDLQLPPGFAGFHHHRPITEDATTAATTAATTGGTTGTKAGTTTTTTTTGTIPMSTYSFASTKDGKTYTGTIVGTSPFASPLTSSTINVVVVPLKITIGTTTFDPTAKNTYDGSVSALTRFQQSPLANNVTNLTINGINVGTTQFVNGFRRAEFWTKIAGSTAYQNTLSFTYASAQSISAGTNGIVYSTGATQMGVVSYSWLDSYLRATTLPALVKAGTVSTAKFVIFLVANVVQSGSTPPTTSNCCILGYHGATGSPVQTYGVMDWDTTGDFGTGTQDGSIASHEIAEWMDDPLGTNATPSWGGIGQVSSCQTNWENGDPLSGTLMPAITLSGKAYHMQELGFFSWYFNSSTTASLGAGGTFSSNGTFKGSSKACVTGVAGTGGTNIDARIQ